NETSHERDQCLTPRGMGLLPVAPRDLVVLRVGVVVAALGAAELVAAQQHRRAEREEQGGEHRALHPAARLENFWILGRALDAPVVGINLAPAILLVRCVMAP